MANCAICGKPDGLTGRKLTKGNGIICRECFLAASVKLDWNSMRCMPIKEIKAIVAEVSSQSNFDPKDVVIHPLYGTVVKDKAGNIKTKERTTLNLSGEKSTGAYILINNVQKTVVFPQTGMGKSPKKIYSFSDILGWELLENDTSVTKGGLGTAAIGGALFGGTGAVTGAIIGAKKTTGVCRSLRIKVTVRDLKNPAVFIDFVKMPVKTSSSQFTKAFDAAQKVLSTLQLVCEENTG